MNREVEFHIKPDGFSYVAPKVLHTEKGTAYLQAPGVAVISQPNTNLDSVARFLTDFGDYHFDDYLRDPDELLSAEELAKFAGQICYASLGERRTMNKDSQRYFDNLISSGHGSVLEHVNISVLAWGVSRSLTHELVRHRAGMAFSQLSQRYVSGRVLRFVERPEFQNDELLHQQFIHRIDLAAETYQQVADRLYDQQTKGLSQILTAEAKTDLRKKVQQSARAVLPNETETWIVVTGNARAWRHIWNMRGSEHAETEIRNFAYRSFEVINPIAPGLFKDISVVDFSDGTKGLRVEHPKV